MLRLLRRLIRDPRALGALLLLSLFAAGEVADARHHLADHGCATDTHAPGQRDDHCTCAGLHALPLGAHAFTDPAPAAQEREFTPATAVTAPRAQRGAEASPRAPPRG
jgi:hypothetical protein